MRLLPARNAEIVRNVSDVDKAKRFLGFEPKTILEVGLGQTHAWFLDATRRV